MRHVGEDRAREEESYSQDSLIHHFNSKGASRVTPITIDVKVDNCLVNMEVDTGACVSLSYRTFTRLWPGRSLGSADVRLQTYSKEPLPVLGCVYVNVEYQGQTGRLPIVVVEGSGPTVMGRDWLCPIQLDWISIHCVHSASLQAVLARYPSVFKEGLGTLKGFEAKIYVDPNATPSFNPARSVPYALHDLVDKELERLQRGNFGAI